jgi:uncharacterized protein YqjF (DUF2071 family)
LFRVGVSLSVEKEIGFQKLQIGELSEANTKLQIFLNAVYLLFVAQKKKQIIIAFEEKISF